MSWKKKIKKAIKKIGPLGVLAAAPVAGFAAKKLGSAAMLAAPGVGILKSLKKKMRPNVAPGAAPSEKAEAPTQEEGNRAGMAGTAMGFKRGGMVNKRSVKGGSSCVGIAKRGFGKALKKSR